MNISSLIAEAAQSRQIGCARLSMMSGAISQARDDAQAQQNVLYTLKNVCNDEPLATFSRTDQQESRRSICRGLSVRRDMVDGEECWSRSPSHDKDFWMRRQVRSVCTPSLSVGGMCGRFVTLRRLSEGHCRGGRLALLPTFCR